MQVRDVIPTFGAIIQEMEDTFVDLIKFLGRIGRMPARWDLVEESMTLSLA